MLPDLEVEGMTEIASSLASLETLDRTSPELWPEPVPGVSGYPPPQHSTQNSFHRTWNNVLDKREDILNVQYFSTLSQKELLTEVRFLYESAYKLGIDEAKEMTRGKYLNILSKGK